jgi:hypothetical protein
MIPKALRVSGYTPVARHTMLERVKAAIGTSGGYIVDFHRFSNAAICLNIMLPLGQMTAFSTALQVTELRLEPESQALLSAYAEYVHPLDAKAREREIPGTVHITFLHNDPDLLIETPMVPG